jgi:hypothetical protein
MNKFSRNLLIGVTFAGLSAIALNIYLMERSPSIEQLSETQNPTEATDPAPDKNLPVTSNTNSLHTQSLAKDLIGGEMLPSNAFQQAFSDSDPAYAWSKVDLEALQSDMPDNLYWLLAAPTSDSVVQEQRKEIKEFWQQQYAKVLSNQATEEEIRAYYEHRNQVSTDYIKFSTSLLNRHSKDLPERDYHFQVLARNIHLVQLEELPKKLQKALENRADFQKRRNEWLADKTAYESQLQAEREEALRALGKI